MYDFNEQYFEVTITDAHVICADPLGKQVKMAWADLQAVIIETNDSGRFGSDVVWRLKGSAHDCVIPLGASGEGDLLDRLLQLTGFDNEMFMRAMQSRSIREFVCWRKPLK